MKPFKPSCLTMQQIHYLKTPRIKMRGHTRPGVGGKASGRGKKVRPRRTRRRHPRGAAAIPGRKLRLLSICALAVSLCFLIVSILLNRSPIRRFPEGLDLERICKTDAPENNWRYIVIHHSATNSGNAEDFDKYHKEVRGWKYGLAYHFVIGNGNGSTDGEIEAGKRWRKQIHGAHTANMDYNRTGIGICIVGNLEEETITQRQFDSLYQIVLYLSKRYAIPSSNIIMHNQVAQKKGTLCPGKNFPYDELINELRVASYEL